MNLLENILKDDYGIRLNEAARQTVHNLNQFPENYILEAKSITNESTRLMYLKYYTALSEHGYLGGFEQQVFLMNAPAATWKTVRMLMPDLTLEEQLQLNINNIPFDGLNGEWMHICPDKARWLAATNTCGAPVLVQHDVNYKTPVPVKTIDMQYQAERLEKNDNLQVVLSRWIAQRLARCMWQDEKFNFDAIRQNNFWRSMQWSAAAKVAFEGLKKELKEVGKYSSAEVPGFVGPAAWYTL